MKIEQIKIEDVLTITKMVGGKDGITGPVVDIKGSWVSLLVDNDVIYKMRAKDLKPAETAPVVTDDISPLPVEEEVAISAPADVVEAKEKAPETQPTTYEWYCPECDSEFISNNANSVQCKKCGAWVQIKLKFNKDRYITGLGVTESGRDTVDIDDTAAGMLRGKSTIEAIADTAEFIVGYPIPMWFSKTIAKQFADYCERNAVDCEGSENPQLIIEAFLETKYNSLNNGMVRMNLGNVIRGCLNRAKSEPIKKADMIAKLKAWAEKNYENGADTFIEAWDQESWDDFVKDYSTYASALTKVKEMAAVWFERIQDAENSSF